MAKLEPSPMDRDEPRLLRRVECAWAHPEQLAGPCDVARVAKIVRRGNQQDSLALVRKPPNALEKDALDLASQRQDLGQRLVAAKLTLAESRGQLDERESVALRLFDQPRADRGGRGPGYSSQ
jgi:hypothetical protein